VQKISKRANQALEEVQTSEALEVRSQKKCREGKKGIILHQEFQEIKVSQGGVCEGCFRELSQISRGRTWKAEEGGSLIRSTLKSGGQKSDRVPFIGLHAWFGT